MLSSVGLPRAAREASDRWSRQLAEWAIPEDVLAAAPESPWGFPPGLFARSAERALADPGFTPSRRRAAEAVPSGGSVLDVGAGGGAASLPLAPPAGILIAVDESQAMLDVFAQGADRSGARHTEIVGRWPDVAPGTPNTDVVVCHHVVYNVGDLAPFLAALTGHAERRVVVELTDRHPQSDLSPLWRAIHGIDRPTSPTASDAAEVAVTLGYDVHVERFERPSLWHDASRDERIAFARRRLCVGPERDVEIGAYLDQTADSGRKLVTVWWDSTVRPEQVR
jgi:SAM-dependent methyltransferase